MDALEILKELEPTVMGIIGDFQRLNASLEVLKFTA